jgi:Ca2+-binding RTX toxin-like protein
MVVILTETGWVDENENILGTWTNQADLLEVDLPILVFQRTVVTTLDGDDFIVSDAYEGIGIDNSGTVKTGQGNDLIKGNALTLGINNSGLIDTGKGNDSIISDFYAEVGIDNSGTIKTGNGSDTVFGQAVFLGIDNSGTIKTGNGNDTIDGVGLNEKGINNSGKIETGNGDDIIVGGGGFDGIWNSGKIETGNGDDMIEGYGGRFVLAISNDGLIETGNGDDTIKGFGGEFTFGIENSGKIETGEGNDTIKGSAGFDSVGIDNSGLIRTGRGNDTIEGNIESYAVEEDSIGINNSGLIDTGSDDDIVDALIGGFDGSGLINLGDGNDLIRGFGTQYVNGGQGFDRAELGIDFDLELLSLISSSDLTIGTMKFSNVESFDFNGEIFNLVNEQGDHDLLTGSGGQTKFAIIAGNGVNTITNFGGVGKGINPTQEIIEEVDILQFFGEGFTAENLLLTQYHSDLELTFAGVKETKVILENFDLEDLDNLPNGIGNILFDGQQQIQDSFDIFNAKQNRSRIFNRNTVTFLNDLDNTTHGFSHSDDVINGQGGNDTLFGRSGDDLLRGNEGDDLIKGGAGNDQLDGGPGDDSLSGGTGADQFILRVGDGIDTILDFENHIDKFLLDSLTFEELTVTQSRSDTVISLTDTSEMLAILSGMDADKIISADFVTLV